MADELDVVVKVEPADANAGLKSVADSVKGLQEQIAGFSDGLRGVKDQLLAAFTVDKIIEFVGAMVEANSVSERLQAQLGASAQQIEVFNLIAKDSGTSVTAISEGFTTLETVINRSMAGVARAQDALASLGVRAKDFEDLSLEDKFDLIASKVAPLRDSTEKTAIVTELLGSAGAALIPILNKGAGALKEYHEIMQRAGREQPEFAREMGRLDMAILEMQASFSAAGKLIVSTFGPALTGLVNLGSRVAQSFSNSVKEGGLFYEVLDKLSIAVKGLVTALVVAQMSMEMLWEATKTVVYAIGESFMRLGSIIKAAFTLNLEEVQKQWGLLTAGLAARMETSRGEITKSAQAAVDQLNVIWNKAGDDKAKIDQTQDAEQRTRNQGALAARMAAYEADVRMAQLAYQKKAALLETEVMLGQTTQNQKFALLMQYNEQAYRESLRALQAAAAIEGLKPQQVAQINARIRTLQAQHDLDMVNLERQSLQAQMTMWQQYTSTIAGSFNSALRGLITYTTSWSQAMKNIMLDLGLEVVKNLVTEPLSKFIAGKLAMLTATTTYSTAQAAAEVAAAETALPAKIAGFTSDLTARAALVFAGVFANLAPFLGPAAAGPAAASEAVVMAQAAAVPKFDVGAWSVPRTGLAVIHAGETILPAGAPAEAYRAAAVGGPQAGGGGAQVAFHISAVDGEGMGRWLRNGGASQLARAVSRAQDKNPSLRPKA